MSGSIPAAQQSDWMKRATSAKEEGAGKPIGPSSKQQQQPSNLYSSIVGSSQAQNGSDNRSTRGDNPFKYSKDDMLNVYTNLVESDKMQSPLNFERYDEVASSGTIQPVNTTEITQEEQAYLSGNINSEHKARRGEQQEARSNGRRDVRNGGRESRKNDTKRGSEIGHMSLAESESKPTAESATADKVEATKEIFSQPQGRHTSRLATMGVFDTSAEHDAQRWKGDKEEESRRNVRQHGDAGVDIDRLSEIYSSQTLSQRQAPLQQQQYADQQTYNPLSNGIPDLFKSQAGGYGHVSQQSQIRNGSSFLGSTPSPSLQLRSEQPPMVARIMVMPDKLKWQYRDPTGQNQGPFSGLEMHDWYKAGFFQPNLLVKREEDEEFEPLSILVRRIGNQREPFLVPLPSRVSAASQSTKSGGNEGVENWPNGQNWSGATGTGTSNGGQPPFPQSFPSFGTTLTAEQQNALERRKQEEQYLMHRQREFLQQQQMSQQRQQHHPGQYGGGHQQQFGYGQERRNSPFSGSGSGGGTGPGTDRQNLPQSYDSNAQSGGWNNYAAPPNNTQSRGQYTDFGVGIFDIPKSEVADKTIRDKRDEVQETKVGHISRIGSQLRDPSSNEAAFSTSQARQTQPTIASTWSARSIQPQPDLASFGAETASATVVAPEDEAEVSDGYEHQQGQKGHGSGVNPAPWAAAGMSRGSSLKAIQDLEIQQDVLRRSTDAKSMTDQAESMLVTPIPARDTNAIQLANFIDVKPSASESGSSAGPAWKPATTTGKKTLSQIQLEEERSRRQLAAAQSPNTSRGVAPAKSSILGTRYADTAMKSNAGSWSTVGSSGKTGNASLSSKSGVMTPVASAMPASVATSRATASNIPAAVSTRPVNPDAISADFFTWAQTALKGLNPGVNFAEFLQLLLSFGIDGGKDTREIISDSIYANSATLDGRRFADEFCKRRKEDLNNKDGQNKSISELSSKMTPITGVNDWSNVVKPRKVEADEEQWNASFKVSSGKGVGKRRKAPN